MSNEIIKYDDLNGRNVELSVEILQRVLPTLKNVKKDEVVNFALRCKAMGLNPLVDVHNVMFTGESEIVVPIVKKDFYLQNASMKSDFRGFKAGVIVDTDKGELIEREGTFVRSNETAVGGWAKVATENRGEFYSSVGYDEYVMTKRDGGANKMWTIKRATMLRKVALSQALREAYPIFAGTYVEEEIDEENVTIDTQAEILEEKKPAKKEVAKAIPPKAEKPTAEQERQDNIMNELFS